MQDRVQEYQPDRRQQDASGKKEHKDVAKRPLGLLLAFFAELDRGIGASACPKQGADGQHDCHDRKRYGCRRIAQKTDSLADKNLIDDVVNRADQHGNDCRQRKLCQQLLHRLISEWVLLFFDGLSHCVFIPLFPFDQPACVQHVRAARCHWKHIDARSVTSPPKAFWQLHAALMSYPGSEYHSSAAAPRA